MPAKHLVLKQAAEKPVPVEVLAEHIQAISQGIRKLREGPLNDRCLFMLVQHAAPVQLGIGTIKAVFDGIDSLEHEYLRKKK